MFRHLVRRSASACLAMGRRILPNLMADHRLTGAAAAMQAGQESLEAKHTAYEDAVESARSAAAARDLAYRSMADRLREFALNVLSTVRNNHGADTYLRYFPMGYGTATREKPEQIPEVTRVVLGKLAEETDPWLVAFRDRISATHEAFLAAQERYVEALRGRNDSFAYLAAEKRLWVQALAVSRLRAREAYLGDVAYLRMIFAPAEAPRRQPAVEPGIEPAAGEGSAETPAKFEVLVGAASSSPAPMRGEPQALGPGREPRPRGYVGSGHRFTEGRLAATPARSADMSDGVGGRSPEGRRFALGASEIGDRGRLPDAASQTAKLPLSRFSVSKWWTRPFARGSRFGRSSSSDRSRLAPAVKSHGGD